MNHPLSHNWKLEDPSFESWSAKIYFSFTLSCFLFEWVFQKHLYINLITVDPVNTCQTHRLTYCISLLGLAITKYQQGGLNNKTWFSHSSRGWEYIIKVSVELIFSEPLALACRWLSPCCVLTQHVLCACTTLVCPCVFRFCLFLRTSVRLDESLL